MVAISCVSGAFGGDLASFFGGGGGGDRNGFIHHILAFELCDQFIFGIPAALFYFHLRRCKNSTGFKRIIFGSHYTCDFLPRNRAVLFAQFTSKDQILHVIVTSLYAGHRPSLILRVSGCS